MKILVCVKQVPDPESAPIIDETSRWILEDHHDRYGMSHYDEYALEEAVLIRERSPGVTIDVISVGPARVRTTLRKAIEKGADRAFHVSCPGWFTPAEKTARSISDHARREGYDLIMTGVISEDLMQGQVGPMLAAMLGMPCATAVVREEMDIAGRGIRVFSELEGGFEAEMILPMPCLLTIQSGINRPRYPSLSNVMRAKSIEPISIAASTFSALLERCDIVSLEYPATACKGIVLGGSVEEKADSLLDILHERSLLALVQMGAGEGGR